MNLQDSEIQSLMHKFLALAIIGAILIAIASTHAYPLAYGILIAALVYVLLEGNNATKVKDAITSVTGRLNQ